MNHFTLLITLVYFIKNGANIILNKECCFSTNSYRQDKWVTLTDFDRFDQLNFNCNQPINMSIWELKPAKKNLILDDSLKLNNLSIRVEGETYFSIELNNFYGFDLKSNPFRNLKLINFKSLYIYWVIRHSYFQFFHKHMSVNERCNYLVTSENAKTQSEGLAQNIRILFLADSVKYYINTCWIIFNNTHFELISVSQISNTFIEKNILEFQVMHANVSRYFKNSIFQFYVTLYHYDLNSKLLDKDIFRSLHVLDFNGVINTIDGDVFKSLKRLKMLRLRTQQVKKLFMVNNKWLEYLNYDVKINLADREDYAANLHRTLILVIFQSFPKHEFYDYNEEDFCYFKNFPHDRMVLPDLLPNDKSSCSCTEIYLIQYSVVFSKLTDFYKRNSFTMYDFIHYYDDDIKTDNYMKCVNSSYNLIRMQCNFAERLEKCKIKTANISTNEGFNLYIYDWLEISTLTRYAFTVYVNLILSVIGIFINSMIILILSYTNLTKDKMYYYLKINAVFNLFHILSLLMQLISKDFDYDSFHGNSREEFIKSQSNEIYYTKLILVTLIGNTARTSANIAHLSFSMSRYITITGKKTNFIARLKNINTKLFFFLTIFISMALNLHLFFEFEMHQKTTLVSVNSLKNFSTYYKHDKSDEYKEDFTQDEYLFLTIFQYIRIIFSDLFYLLFITTVDLFLFYYVKKKMIKKIELLSNRAAVDLIMNPLGNSFRIF